MKYVLVTVFAGIIDHVVFFDDASKAIDALSGYVGEMNPEKEDAAVYEPEGMIANAKDFLDEEENYIDNSAEILARIKRQDKPIYIIANPLHRMGFMVVSPDDPLGYKISTEAVSDLGQMRKDTGRHLKLFQVEPVSGPLTDRKDLEKYNAACEVEDFDYSIVEEYWI